MNRIFNTTTLLWALRQVLQFGGAWLVFNGYANADDVDQATEAFYQLAGPVSFLIGFAFNIFSTFRSHATVDGQKVPLPELPLPQAVKQEVREAIAKRPTLLERMFGGKR